jgi:hypothetical protein
LLGFSYLWRDDLDNAEKPMQVALALTERTGDVVLQSRCLTYLATLYRRLGQAEKVQKFLPRCIESAKNAEMPEYIGTAKANMAWISWCEGNLSEVEVYGQAALDTWQKVPAAHASCAFQWIALWPLIAVAHVQNQDHESIEYVRALLDPNQKRLPDRLTSLLENAVITWEEDGSKMTSTYLDQAIELAKEMRYL